MAMNLSAVLKIAAQVTGLDGITKLERGLQGAEQAAVSAKEGFKAVLNSSAWQATAAAAAGFGVAMGVAVKAAIGFESSMADVRKVVDGLENPKAFSEMKAEILDLSRQMPITAEGFAEIYAAAGQSGIAKGELKEFATMVANVAVAFDMTAGEAGTALAQMRVALGLSNQELMALADAMNYVSNNTGATASSLVEFMSRSGSAGKIAGLSAEQTMAFGAAMVQTGVQSEVAATSFNNMVKALSKGPSMTDRQVSALQRMGYSMVNAASMERDLTRAVESESRRRIDLARAETNQLSKEIQRRYRDQLQAIQDSFDDEAEAYEEGLQDRADAQIKALQKQQDKEIKAAQARADAAGKSADAEVDRIREAYDKRTDAIREGVNDELKIRRRADRDELQAVRDRVEDQREAELSGVQQRFEAKQEMEQQYLERARADAKVQAQQAANDSAQSFADQLQSRGAPMIMEVLKRIAQLPKSQQISVLSDLFGDEARGLAPLLANLGELDRVLGLATDAGASAGSVLQEAAVRSQTTANELQLLNNQWRALSIEVGDQVLPMLIAFLKYLNPIIEGIGKFAQSNPQLTTALVTIGGIVSALVLAAPFIVSVITLLGQLAALKIGATIAGWLGVLVNLGPMIAGFQAALTGLLAWVSGTFIPALLAFFSGPAGWTVLALAAVVALAIAFREPIMEFLSWLGEAFMEGLKVVGKVAYDIFLKPWVELFKIGMRAPISEMWKWLQETWNKGVQFITTTIGKIADAAKAPFLAVVNTVRAAFNAVLSTIGSGINIAIRGINTLIAGYNRLPAPDLPFIPSVSVPQFAEGGVVNRPTLAMVGEGGEREYIIPESKMGAAASAYMGGARGASVLGPSTINVTTGPVLQQQGQTYVTMADLQRAMRATEAGTLARIRTPAGRTALGIR